MKASPMLNRIHTAHLLVFVLSLVVSSESPLHQVTAQDEPNTSHEPQVVDITTSDGVKLKCEFYPGTKGKESIPVIALHEWDKNRQSNLLLAGHLQEKLGCAVIVPDLRGHGDSRDVVGSTEKLNRDKWKAFEIGAIMEDIEACKKYLIEKNNGGELNIDLLTIVAEAESNIHAVAWTLRDWSFGDLGSLKQGRDVKALVMINPKRNFKGLSAIDHLKSPLFTGRGVPPPLPVLIATDSRTMREGKSVYDNLARGRKARDMNDNELEMVKFREEKSQRVVKSKNVTTNLNDIIAGFIENRVNSKQHEFRWQDRTPN